MTYVYNPKTNKNRFFFYILIILCVAGGIGSFFFLNKLTAAICCAISLYISWCILKAISSFMGSKIVTYTDGFTVYSSLNEKQEFSWNRITHAGHITGGKNDNQIFAYMEECDKIAVLPAIFKDFDSFVSELKSHTDWKEYCLSTDETISSYLKKQLAIQDKKKEDN